MASIDPASPIPSAPWWRVRMMWLVVGGPAFVVVMSLLMAGVAIRGADPVLAEGQLRIGPRSVVDGETPALVARNHATRLGATQPRATDSAAPAVPVNSAAARGAQRP